MGLLDDAIREHLDLKRRRGADPAEVERAEHEALGPVRRNRDPDDGVDPQDEDAVAGGFAYDQDDDEGWDTDVSAGNHVADLHRGLIDDLDEDEPGAHPEEPAPLEDWTAAGDDDLGAEPFPTTSGSTRRPADPGGDETTEYHIEETAGPHADEGDEDMLEETPEFLQDTPDHDRLWFEQRPPRDFDFDE
ncbi:MAG TPA: hypothetical protein VG325_16015 [Solirubrobacteraceae bacterium]|nr:hypothetical protein [Solirubrobacteraceae bacterium]